jgi:hypothetical protein
MVAPLTPDDPPSLGEFHILGRLGEGGQGVVYLARAASGEQVAVKLLTRVDPESRTRLSRELDALASVASFCTARVLAADVRGPRPYVVSEFVDGPSLEQRVRERGPLRGGELERLMVGTATALAAVHAAGVVHRDFKPGNVLLGPDGPRVVDFGIARSEGAATLTAGLIGTPAYLSPEQIGGSAASPASDVFGWAATMLYAAVGTPPFGADNVPAVLHRVLHQHPDLSPLPPHLRGLVGACLDKHPGGRPTARSLMVGMVDPGADHAGRGAGAPQGRDAGPPPGRDAGPLPPDLAARGVRIAAGETDPGLGVGTHASTGGRSRRPLLAGVVIAVALLVTAGAVAWLNLAERDPNGVTSGTPGPTAETTRGAGDGRSPAPEWSRDPTEEPVRSPDPTAEETGSLAIPGSFAGTWAGHIVPSAPPGLPVTLKEHDVRVRLEAGRPRGRWEEPTSNCEGTLRLAEVAEEVLTFMLEEAGTCVPGTLTLTRKGAALAYHWTDGFGLNTTYQGDLRKR